ncbi:hypothetical protein, partial [Listeria monocytogenes]|uniref:hypothetical protein n=1 Tax=Listeria monocytogenes TaxID=1639 RepID=UPI002FDC267E
EVAKADKSHRFLDLCRLKGLGRQGRRRVFVVGAKVVEGVVCLVIDKGFQAGMEAPATSSTLAEHKRSVERQDRMKTAAE